MRVTVNATYSERVMLSQVSLYVSLGEVGDDGSVLMSNVTKRVSYLLDFMKRRDGCVMELQACGLRPHFVLKEEVNGGSKCRDHVQSGYEAYASLVIHVPFGCAKLNPIVDAVKHVNGTLSARYTMSDTLKGVHEANLRCKLIEKAVEQCKELLSHSDGTERQGVVITLADVSYHVVDASGVAAYKTSDRAGVAAASLEDESGYDLDSIYTRENAQHIIMKDSVTVVFDVTGYEL